VRGFRWLCAGALLLPLGALLILVVDVLIDGLAGLGGAALAGLAPALLGSLAVLGLTGLVAVPVGVGAAIYLQEYEASGRVGRLIESNVAALAGLPTLLYGLLGLALFVPSFGRGLVSAALTLALLILPLVFQAVREALAEVPAGLREAATALGATRWQVVRRVVLPAAAPGIAVGLIRALARALGAAAPLVVLGLLVVDGDHTALPVEVFAASTGEAGPGSTAAVAVLVLLGLVFALELLAQRLRARSR
jgi:phosphate transport system permease protein